MAPQTRTRRIDPRLGALCLSALFVLASYAWHHTQVPTDFYALYLAADNFAAGARDQVYAAPHAYFNLAVPETWHAQAAGHGIEGQRLYPFIYPPLWAALFAPLTQMISPQGAAQIAYVLNPALLAASAWLAYRIVQPRVGLLLWMAVALPFLGLTSIGAVASFQNQPQILVSFLILLALERDRAGAPVAAGVAMALAAAIKLYPLLFALMWLATRNSRALISFAMAGAALGLCSIALAGWPLHQEFLTWIKTISNTLFTCTICYNVDATIAQYAFADQLRHFAEVMARGHGEVANVLFSVKSAQVQLLDKLLLLAVLGLAYAGFRKADAATRFGVIWPAMILAVAFVSPLTWAYHYITAAAFVPLLIGTLGRAGKWHVAALFALFSMPTLVWLESLPTGFLTPQFVGTAGILYLIWLFLRPLQQPQARALPLSA